MKKSIILIIGSILFLALIAISVSATGTVATVDNKSCPIDGTVTLNVNITNTSGVTSGAVEVIYDKTVLELDEAQWHTPGASIAEFIKNDNRGAFAFKTGQNLGGKIFSVTFKVRADAPVGKTNVECKIVLKSGTDDISVVNNAGSIDITCKHNFTEKNDKYPANAASCENPLQYYYTCSLCGEKGNTIYDVGAPLPHSYDKQVATATYLVNSVKCVNEAEYYYSCSCGSKGSETFKADARWSHNYSDTLFIGAEGHWHQCLDCGEKDGFAGHSPNSSNVCSGCQFVLSNDGTHYHSFDTTWKKSEDAHWHECSCGIKDGLELHNWDNGTITKPASENEEGKKLYTCSDCGQTKTEKIEKLGSEQFGGGVSAPISSGKSNPVLTALLGMLILLAIEAAGFGVYKVVKNKASEKALNPTPGTTEATKEPPNTDRDEQTE